MIQLLCRNRGTGTIQNNPNCLIKIFKSNNVLKKTSHGVQLHHTHTRPKNLTKNKRKGY